MEQRPLRLGDLVDDYCPRERRVTNHAIVAIVNDGIRQTRCTTCDTEHVFKGAKAPRHRKKDGEPSPPAVPDADVTLAAAGPPATEAAPPPEVTAVLAAPEATRTGPAGEPAVEAEAEDDPPHRPEDNAWFVHRRLIRAQLPRTENDVPPPRPIPEFTMHQRHGRGARDGQGWANRDGNVNGNTANGNPSGNGHGRGFRGPGGSGRPPFGQGQEPGAGRPRRHGRRRPR